jgi:hypothetical protein
MAEDLTEREKQSALKTAETVGSTATAVGKLRLTHLDVDVPRHISKIQTLETVLEELKASDAPNKAEQITEVERRLEDFTKDRIVATLVPLSAMDLLVVQGWISEASRRGLEVSFDLDVRLFMLAKSEQCGTIYLALRQQSNRKARYFENQEDVVLLDDQTLMRLSRLYRDAFVLTDDERKNS